MQIIKLKKNEERRVIGGHPWIFSNEIEGGPGGLTPGQVVEVQDWRGRFVGRGYANPRSLITVRLLTRNPATMIDRDFFRRRLADALAYRRSVIPDDTSYRLVFGEGDFLPGLIVDRYRDYLVIQSLTAGIEQWLEVIADLLEELVSPAAIILRNDSPVRNLEGLPLENRVLRGHLPGPVEAREYGLRFSVNLLEGQKTGFFLDQRENRAVLEGLCRGRRVLDCFSYVGAWALHAARGGAREVIGLDASAAAVQDATENARLNGLGGCCEFRRGDVFDELKRLAASGERFDCVVLDPPAFVKSKVKLKEGLKGYREINLRALKLIPEGGWLVTSSCSYHVDRNTFMAIIAEAAADAGRRVRLMEYRSQAKDHPVNPAVPETEYLKCAFLQVI